VSGDHGYVVPCYNGARHGKVGRFDLATFSQVQVLDLTSTDGDLKGFNGGFASGGYGYFVPGKNPNPFGKVARVDLDTFSQVQVLDLTATDADLKGFYGGFASSGHGFVVPYFNGAYFGKVARFATPPGRSFALIRLGVIVSTRVASVILHARTPLVLNHALSRTGCPLKQIRQ